MILKDREAIVTGLEFGFEAAGGHAGPTRGLSPPRKT